MIMGTLETTIKRLKLIEESISKKGVHASRLIYLPKEYIEAPYFMDRSGKESFQREIYDKGKKIEMADLTDEMKKDSLKDKIDSEDYIVPYKHHKEIRHHIIEELILFDKYAVITTAKASEPEFRSKIQTTYALVVVIFDKKEDETEIKSIRDIPVFEEKSAEYYMISKIRKSKMLIEESEKEIELKEAIEKDGKLIIKYSFEDSSIIEKYKIDLK